MGAAWTGRRPPSAARAASSSAPSCRVRARLCGGRPRSLRSPRRASAAWPGRSPGTRRWSSTTAGEPAPLTSVAGVRRPGAGRPAGRRRSRRSTAAATGAGSSTGCCSPTTGAGPRACCARAGTRATGRWSSTACGAAAIVRGVYAQHSGAEACGTRGHADRPAGGRSSSSRAARTRRTSSRACATARGPTRTTRPTAAACGCGRGSSASPADAPPWMRYAGRWGASRASWVPGEMDSPRGPAFQGVRWDDPSAWALSARTCTRVGLRRDRRVRRARDDHRRRAGGARRAVGALAGGPPGPPRDPRGAMSTNAARRRSRGRLRCGRQTTRRSSRPGHGRAALMHARRATRPRQRPARARA